MTSSRSPLVLVFVVAGYILILPGQLMTFYRSKALEWVAPYVGDHGRWLLDLTHTTALPPGALVAVALVLVGTLVVALGIRAAHDPELPAADSRTDLVTNDGPRPSRLLLGGALMLSAATLFICRLEEPRNIALATWLGSIVCGAWFVGRADTTSHISPSVWWNRRELGGVAALTALSFIVVVHDLMSWRWSGTPDETFFFAVAKNIADGTSRFLLDERGVFEVHPTLSSVYQSMFMIVLGRNGFAWRLSSAVALAVSVPALYVLARGLWNRRVAAMSALLFGTTPLAVGFAHLGYNNAQLYPVVVGSLMLIIWAHRHASLSGFYWAGAVAGLGFYTYYPARLAPLLALWLGVCIGAFSAVRPGRRATAAFILALALVVVPAASHPVGTLARMFRFTSITAGGSLVADDFGSLWQLVTSADYRELAIHWFLALVYPVYFVGGHHFQRPPVVDWISGPLVLVGLWLCLAGIRHPKARFLAATYTLSALLIGGTSQYFRPPLTRLLFLSPFAALLAAVAIDTLASAVTRRAWLRSAIACVVAGAAAACGVGWLQWNVRAHYHGYRDGTTAELVRLALEQPDDTRLIYVQRTDTDIWTVDTVLDQYGMKDRLTYLRGFDDRARAALEQAEPPFVAAMNLPDGAQRHEAQAILSNRFPGYEWHSSDPGRPWALAYFVVGKPGSDGS